MIPAEVVCNFRKVYHGLKVCVRFKKSLKEAVTDEVE